MLLKGIFNSISYWYFRYLLVTELYMVEKWERHMFHVMLLIFTGILYLFNSYVTLSLVRMLVNLICGNTVLNGPGNIITSTSQEL